MVIARWGYLEHCSGCLAVRGCYLPDGRNLSVEMVTMGLALDWAKFSGGLYRSFEPAGIRKKLWRVEARHRGQFPPQPPPIPD